MEIVEVLARLKPPGPGVVQHPELRREAGGFLLPVEDERPGHDDQRGPASGAFSIPFPLFASRLQERQHLHRLAETHVVGQTPAKAELLEEAKPAEPVALVRAQLTDEPVGGVTRLDALEPPQLLARPCQGRITRASGSEASRASSRPTWLLPNRT